jgi:uncharacterized protein (TIGR00661 family)
MKRVLVAALDWGLGHATRSIPVIRKLIAFGCEVWIGGNGESLELLKKEFPNLKTVSLPGYEPRYPTSSSMVWKMLLQIPKFVRVIGKEHAQIEKVVNENKIELIISDNRYGLWSAHVPSVFITHQSNILMPNRFGWLHGAVRYFNHRQMEKFSVCWIPDFPNENSLSKDLSRFASRMSAKHEFIGTLSRFKYEASTIRYDILAILSGPEPQRSILENTLVPQIQKSGLNYFIVLGQIKSGNSYNDPRIASFLTSEDLKKKILSSEIIISRSGYSSVMDLSALRKKAIFIPTPGQTEQEYLAETLMKKQVAFSMSQKEFDLRTALEASTAYTGFPNVHASEDLLENALRKVLTIDEPVHHNA